MEDAYGATHDGPTRGTINGNSIQDFSVNGLPDMIAPRSSSEQARELDVRHHGLSAVGLAVFTDGLTPSGGPQGRQIWLLG